MTAKTEQQLSNDIVNVPNTLTAIRLLLSIAVFALIPFGMYQAALIIFLIAVSTDWIDGYYARKYNQVTKVGRIFDPFVDKVIICGTFICLAAEQGSGIYAWMAVVVIGREMLVTALRAEIEASGGDFSASFAGKLKMVFQCAAVVASLLALMWADGLPTWLQSTLHVIVGVSVGSTILSGLDYVFAAARFFREEDTTP
ncbi:MAG: CDP-diacylglycerol--glycerol-3-phosphate 3-phosphatidyltransferase [Planctomycetaceae bacterium]|nr:CDP-diacylglycerol--glycerol-3-phosphate 3-phosphatidyltransferase [Planctomycetaceae bacterium]